MNLGILRVKNEARWIARCVSSIMPVCQRVLVMDDHSTDDTREICRAIPGVDVLESPFTGTDEARDKNWLLTHAMDLKPEWIVAIDGDEMLGPGAAEALLKEMDSATVPCLSLRVWYLWNSEDHVRTDGVYGDFHRESVFRPNGQKFTVNPGSPNFHCGNVPYGCRQKRRVLRDVPLLHFGYMHREDRERKFAFYNAADPGNEREDTYRHVAIGDLFPANSKFKHGGPLKLEPLAELMRPVCA